ncbi:MAG: hypothetical protein GKR96_01260 [Gammaproteobacteria bacterium]|nr:hypothetical protein [Gammaproteobacteria bacterium]
MRLGGKVVSFGMRQYGVLSLLIPLLSACTTADLSLRQNLPDRDVEFTFKYFSGFRVESLDAERKSRLNRYEQWLNAPETFEQRSQGAIDSRQTVVASAAANLQRDKSVLEKYQVSQNLDTNRIQRQDDFQQALSKFESQRLGQTQRINESTTQLIEQGNDLKLAEIKSAFSELNALRDRQGRLGLTISDLTSKISRLEAGQHNLTSDQAALDLQDAQTALDSAEAALDAVSQRRGETIAQVEGLFGNAVSPNGNFVTSLPAPVITEVTLGDADGSSAANTISLSTNVPQAQNPQVDRQISELAAELGSISAGLDKLLNGEVDALKGLEKIGSNDIDSTPLERIRNKEATLEYLLEQMRDNQITSKAMYGGYVQRALPFEIGFQPGAETESGVSARIMLSVFEDDVEHVSKKIESILVDHIQRRYETNRVYLGLISENQYGLVDEDNQFNLYDRLMVCGELGREGDCAKYALEFSRKAQSANRSLGVDNENTDLYRAYELAIQYLVDINNQDNDDCLQSQNQGLGGERSRRDPYRIIVDQETLMSICRIRTEGLIGSGMGEAGSKSSASRGRFTYNTPFSKWGDLGLALHKLQDVYGPQFENANTAGNATLIFEFIESLTAALYTDARINESSVFGKLKGQERKSNQERGVGSNITLTALTTNGRMGFDTRINKPVLVDKLSDYIRFLISPKIIDNSARERVIEIADTEAVSRLLNAAVTANDVSAATGVTVGAEIVNALARSTAFKSRVPYATPFTGVVNQEAPSGSSSRQAPYFGWTFYQVPIGIAKNGKLSYEFKTIPAQTTVVVHVPQWLRRIKAIYQYRSDKDWIDHGVEAIELTSHGASFEEFRQFVEYEIFDAYPDSGSISPVVALNGAADGNAASARGCNNQEPYIHVSRHSESFALCGERLYGVRNLIVGGVMLEEEELTRVSDKVMLVKTRGLVDKPCAAPKIRQADKDNVQAMCPIELVHEYGVVATPMNFAWIDDKVDFIDHGSSRGSSGRNSPANGRITMETIAGLDDIYRMVTPYVFDKDNPIRSVFVDKRYLIDLTKRSRIISDKRIELDIRKSHLVDFCGQDTQRVDCVITVYKTETRDPSDVQIGLIDMADYGWKPYSPPEPGLIRNTLTKDNAEKRYILRIQNYRENRFFPLRYVKIGNHRMQNLDTLTLRSSGGDIELSIAENAVIDQCGGQLASCQLDVTLVEKFIDKAVSIGKVVVPFDG